MNYKILISLISFSFIFIFSTHSIYGTCTSYDFVEVSQNNIITKNYSFTDSTIYVNGNTQSSPVTLDFFFQSSEECSQNYSLQTILNQLDEQIQKEQVTKGNLQYTKVKFLVNNLDIDESNLIVLYHSGNSYIKGVELRKDETNPFLEVITRNSQTGGGNIVAPNSNISFEITTNDIFNGYGSGIYSVQIGGREYIHGEDGFENNYLKANRTVFTSQTIQITAKDYMGRTSTQPILIQVDGDAPQISQFTSKGVLYQNRMRVFGFSVVVSDSSFDENNAPQNLKVKFFPNNILSGTDVISSYCNYYTSSQYICHFENIPVVAPSTSLVSLNISAEDDLENRNNLVIPNVEIFIDSQPPKINEFYFENSFGGKNIVSPSANGSIILYLEYYDETGLSEGRGIETSFEEIQFPVEGDGFCDEGCKFWNFSTGDSSDNFGNYVGLTNDFSIFRVLLRDEYGYTTQGNITLLFDRYTPKIINSTYLEGDETCQGDTIVRDSLIQSCEEFDIKVTIHELEERFGEDLTILGNFSTISTSKRLVSPKCGIDKIENKILEYSCVFENLRAAQGYLFENYSIIVQDSAGNKVEEYFEFEILNASYDGTNDIYAIDDLEVLAPLSRVLLDQENGIGEVTAWFEGEIKSNNGADISDFEIVNYRLLNCADFIVSTNAFGDEVLRVQNEGLYGNLGIQRTETIFTSDSGDSVDNDFIMSFILDKVDNPTLLTESLETQCTMALLYRDATTIYEPAQLINFSVEVSFYELPRGHLLRAYAEDLNSDLEKIEKTEEWFGDIYDTYETFHDMCNTWTSVSTTISTLGSSWNIISNGLKATPAAGITPPIDNTVGTTQGTVSMFSFDGVSGIFDEVCGYVTCKNTLNDGFTDFMNTQYAGAASYCGDLAASFSVEGS